VLYVCVMNKLLKMLHCGCMLFKIASRLNGANCFGGKFWVKVIINCRLLSKQLLKMKRSMESSSAIE